MLEYPHLTAKVTEQCIADQKCTILARNLLSEVDIETIRMLINHPTARIVEPLENAADEEIVQPVMDVF